ncbi:MAG TPA: vitamin B12-dependent ribonucleotide reductase [Clostridia bacterium]|nr:vitamin B12-dependent ribonucleotide reductase [Clostridia bacterium]
METLGKNALTVLERRYLTKNERGELIETPEGMFRRVADAVAEADRLYDKDADVKKTSDAFFDLMSDLAFMPNSPTLMNAGKSMGQLSACFVLPVEDSMTAIFDAVKNAALIHQSGGGTGFSFSRLRPAGSMVRSTGGVASGPVSFMKVFNAATEAVKQGGTRRGANMGILRVDHPDIAEFIRCKSDLTEITNFNISVGLTEAFMQAVEADEEYDIIDPRTKKLVEKKRAREIFDLIVDMAWQNGEPGIVFLDRMNRDNVVPSVGEIESTNPCGEQPLLPYESCNLGSINLIKMLRKTPSGYEIDYERLGSVIDTAVHFLDNVIDVNKYPLDEIAEMTRSTRKIGLGVMAFADILYRLGVPYNSKEGVELAEKLMGFIQARADRASAALAKMRGAFPLYEKSTLAGSKKPLRNATRTTIAPTGTISIICNASSGVEPLFALAFFRNVMDNDELPQVDPYFVEIAKREGFYSDELMRRIAKEGTLHDIEEVPEHIKRVFVTAHDIAPADHINIQAAFQNHTDNAVSKTVNFKHDATREDVSEAFVLAYKLKCKGVTIYRDGSRTGQVLNLGVKKEETPEKKKDIKTIAHAHITPRPRPEVTRGITEKVVIGCGNLYITVNYDDEGICEVFANLGRAGGCPSQSEATSRLISTALRSGMDVEAVIEQLKGIRCHSTLRQRATNKNIKVLSCPDAIGRVLEKVAKMKAEEEKQKNGSSEKHEFVPAEENEFNDVPLNGHAEPDPEKPAGMPCPECGSEMEHEGGCVICRGCGYSKCG